MENLKKLLLLFLILSISLPFSDAVHLEEACSLAWKTCSVHWGNPPFNVSSECCKAITHVGPKCFFRPFKYLYFEMFSACQNYPIPTPTPSPSSSSCPFADACNVKFKGFFPIYNISNPDCCNIVKSSFFPHGKCLIYTPIFFKIKYHDCLSNHHPKSPWSPPPPQAPPGSSSTPHPPPPSSPQVRPTPPKAPPQAPPVSPLPPPSSPKATPPMPSPPPPTSSSCAFVTACNVQVIGSSYSYNLKTQDDLTKCCRIVRGTHNGDLGSECSQDVYRHALDDIGKLCFTVPPIRP
ncbi:hypothetical protein M9H77_21263 [Catharanthus roseus]|uniref:Uncharacterized protein n=1 Tax=Catharanthus roseus TaxID=4058 RepID=A0ACC0ANV6_CATRO|nr:hypothetical protein M9H77_21263 [Catharanthus roseus]